MNEPQGPGWWQASDGAWYGPETHPDPAHRAQYAPAGLSNSPLGSDTPSSAYPARLSVEPGGPVSRWRAVGHVFMLIPHLLVTSALGYVASVVMFISWVVVLFTGRLPEGLHNFSTMVVRYNNRNYGYALWMTEEYPPFDFAMSPSDPTSYPVRTEVDYAGGPRNRLTVFFRLFMLIPLAIVGVFLIIGAYVAAIVGFFAVLFVGRLPEGIRGFLVRVLQWGTRVSAYAYLLTDEYPPFGLD